MTLTFPDAGLHMAVLGALLGRQALRSSELRARLAGIGAAEPGEPERVRAAVRRLHDWELPAEAMGAIESLDFDGGNDVYRLLEVAIGVDTGGASRAYELRSLAGIDALAGLTALDLDGHGHRDAPLDLRPLSDHPLLATLRLSGSCTYAAVLETLPLLRTLTPAQLDDPRVLERLVARGVTVA